LRYRRAINSNIPVLVYYPSGRRPATCDGVAVYIADTNSIRPIIIDSAPTSVIISYGLLTMLLILRNGLPKVLRQPAVHSTCNLVRCAAHLLLFRRLSSTQKLRLIFSIKLFLLSLYHGRCSRLNYSRDEAIDCFTPIALICTIEFKNHCK